MNWFRRNYKKGGLSELETKKKKKSINWSWECIRNDGITFILGSPELAN